MSRYPRGWINDPKAVDVHLSTLINPSFASAAPALAGSGENRTVLPFKAWKEVNGGRYPEYPAQEIGDCVSQGFAHGADLLAAVEIALARENESYEETATEAVYGFARVDIGGRRLGRGDGAVGAWAAKAVSEIGTVSRKVVGPYSGKRAKLWGFEGVPAEIKAKAGDHKIMLVRLVSTFEELEDALANGYPVPVCSDQGFTLERDGDGFCRPKGTWAHCMLIIGVRGGSRPGACILNSWGSGVPSGPLALDQPPGSFWADRDVVARMLAARDSWALGRFDGYPGRVLPERWSYAGFA